MMINQKKLLKQFYKAPSIKKEQMLNYVNKGIDELVEIQSKMIVYLGTGLKNDTKNKK